MVDGFAATALSVAAVAGVACLLRPRLSWLWGIVLVVSGSTGLVAAGFGAWQKYGLIGVSVLVGCLAAMPLVMLGELRLLAGWPRDLVGLEAGRLVWTHVEGPPWRRERNEQRVELRRVGWIGWDVEPGGDDRDLLVFYDRDPVIELTASGLMATDPEAELLGEVPTKALLHSPVHLELARVARQRSVKTVVDLDTLEPLRGARPPLAAGTTFTAVGASVYRPPNPPIAS